ncbi:MAG: ABC transporter substrate-binding protein [Catenulispora sp.]|nr:ABC transporter substrate-binding protein [Catenulispora sp.]
MKKVSRVVAVAAASSVVLAGCSGGGPGGGSGKISDGKIVLGVLTDESGPYAELAGKGAVEAVKMAVEDYKAQYGSKAVTQKIDVVDADTQNKPDVANTKAAELYDRQQADVVLDVPNSAAALSVATQAKNHKKLYIDISAASTALHGASCNKYTFQYAYDTRMLAYGTGTAVTKNGAKNWYIVYPDYAFGQDMQKSFTAAVGTAGGTVQAHDPTPFPGQDFSTYLLKAKSASPKPDVLGIMQAGGDLQNLVKQYNSFKLADAGIPMAVGLMTLTDIHSLGPDAFAGVEFTDPWYWNFDATNRAWADKFQARTGKRPTFVDAANYSAALQYLKTVQTAGTDASDSVVKGLEGAKVDDLFGRGGTIRAADHLLVHDAYLAKVKPAAQVSTDWDYEQIVQTIPGDQAFAPAAESGCKL